MPPQEADRAAAGNGCESNTVDGGRPRTAGGIFIKLANKRWGLADGRAGGGTDFYQVGN